MLNTHNWLSSFILPDTNLLKTVSNRYRTGRGSANLIIRNDLPEKIYVKEASSIQAPNLPRDERKTEPFIISLPLAAINKQERLSEKSPRLSNSPYFPDKINILASDDD